MGTSGFLVAGNPDVVMIIKETAGETATTTEPVAETPAEPSGA
jgi:hypothetical protein